MANFLLRPNGDLTFPVMTWLSDDGNGGTYTDIDDDHLVSSDGKYWSGDPRTVRDGAVELDNMPGDTGTVSADASVTLCVEVTGLIDDSFRLDVQLLNSSGSALGTRTLTISANQSATNETFNFTFLPTSKASWDGMQLRIATSNYSQNMGGDGIDLRVHSAWVEGTYTPVGLTVNVGQATETDTSNAVSRTKTMAVAQATETDVAQPVTVKLGGVLVEVGQALESDTATVTTWSKTITVGQATEADTSQPVSFSHSPRAIGLSSELDTAQPVTHAHSARQVGQATEADAAQAVMWGHSARQVGSTTELDSALAVQSVKVVAVGQAAEAGSATAIAWTKTMAVVQAQETDEALAISAPGKIDVGQAQESSTAQPVTWSKVVALSQATESSTSTSVTWTKTRAITQAVELDQSFTVAAVQAQIVQVGLATELDSATAVLQPQFISVAQVVEVDAALGVIWPGPDVELRADALTITTQVHELHLSVDAPGLELSPELYLDTTPDSEHLLNVLMRTSGVQSDTKLDPPFLDTLIGTLTTR